MDRTTLIDALIRMRLVRTRLAAVTCFTRALQALPLAEQHAATAVYCAAGQGGSRVAYSLSAVCNMVRGMCLGAARLGSC